MMQPPRKADESIVNGWLFFRYLVIGSMAFPLLYLSFKIK